MSIESLSKFLSLVLRHKPETIGVTLDAHGWVDVDKLINGCRKVGKNISAVLLERVVIENDKMRFSFNANKTKIRANQGHSRAVDVELEEMTPPLFLYHGTLARNEKSIMESGLSKMKRLHVHLSVDVKTARKVAARRVGASLICKIDSGSMARDGFKFYQSVNGVWLTDHVPPQYITILRE
ncbi:MAG: RNA 2'-phosphotransferase [Selenomonadaceae bacterium]|nr:RNA 2'-phosphotransferase [Selenomonadaceae bacterium]